MDTEKYIDFLVDIADSIKVNEVTILTGRNAGGKSLIRKLLTPSIAEQLGKKKAFIPHASQELRTKSNPEMGALSGMGHDVEWLATSDNTLSVMNKVFKHKDADFVIIDEPEIGMGEELQLGMVDYLNEKIKNFGKGALVITHSRITVANLVHNKFINLEGMSYEEWLTREPKKLPVEEFEEFATILFKAVRDRINNNKNKK